MNNFVTSIESRKIDILIHNAGIFSDEQLKEDLDTDVWMNEMRINAVIPIILHGTKEQLKNGSDKSFISSQCSTDDNYSGRFYFYRSSKSALNSAARSLSIDWKEDGISVLILHPGCKTDMVAQVPPRYLRHYPMINVINELNLITLAHFLNYEGKNPNGKSSYTINLISIMILIRLIKYLGSTHN